MRFWVPAAVIGTAALLVSAAAAAPGQLDPSFGTGGGVTTNFAGGNDQAYAVVEQPDGKLVVGGDGTSAADPADQQLELARYNTDGSLDSSFGTGGEVRLALGTNSGIEGLALQPDGKIVAVGFLGDGSGEHGMVYRFTANGATDTSFGNNGLYVTSGNVFPGAVAVQPDGKIVTVGTSFNSNFSVSEPVVLRLDSTGALDPTFGSGGVANLSFGTTDDQGVSLALQPDGKIVIAGAKDIQALDASFAVARLLADGALDTSFGGGAGFATSSFAQGPSGAESVALQPDGKIVLGGFIGELGSTVVPVVRFNADGTPDPTFVPPSDNANEQIDTVAIQPDGKIVAIGSRSEESDSAPSFLVTRLDANGAFDPSFGTNGIATGSIQGNEIGYAGLLQPDGKIVVVGSSSTWNPAGNSDFAVMRFLGEASSPQTVTFLNAPQNPVFGGHFRVRARSSVRSLPIAFASETPSVCVLDPSQPVRLHSARVDFVGAGVCTIDASQAGTATYEPASAELSFTVARADQSFHFTSSPGPHKVGDSYVPSASIGAAGNAAVFSIDLGSAAVCSLSPDGTTVTYLAVGVCTIDADEDGSADYNPAPQRSQSVNVNPGRQAIVFTSTPPADAIFGGSYVVSATGGASGDPVVFTVAPGAADNCSLAGDGVTVGFIGAGTCTIRANQDGNANYEAASQESQSFTIAKAAQTITVSSAPSSGTVGGSGSILATGGGSGNPLTFTVGSSSTAGACKISGSTVTYNKQGTCVITINQGGNSNYTPAPQAQVTIAVSKTLTF